MKGRSCVSRLSLSNPSKPQRNANTIRLVIRLAAIMEALDALDEPIVFPVHPRTRNAISALHRPAGSRVRIVEPVGYHDMLMLARHARMVLTDSGGVQKEAFFLGTPCVTLRETTEWAETVEAGWNRLVGADPEGIVSTVRTWKPVGVPPSGMFGDGHASERIAEILSILGRPA